MAVVSSYRLLTRLCRHTYKNVIVRYTDTITQKKLPGTKDDLKNTIPDSEPSKIKAAVLKKFSDPLCIENCDLPKALQNNEVVIDVDYCAINASDILLSQNLYTYEPTLPLVLGYELVGKLIEVGEVAQNNGYNIGDKVIALNSERYGGLAEKCVASIGDIWKIPSSIKLLDAVCLLDNYMTALLALERKVELNENDMILINVGISGVGLAAVDLATNVYRAKVIGICATEDGASFIREKGAFASLKFKSNRLLKEIENIAAERNIKAVFDGVGGEEFKKILNCFTDIYKDDTSLRDSLRDDNFAVVVQHLSREGRVVVAGVAATNMKVHSEVEKGSFSISGFNLSQYRKKNPDVYRQAGDEVLQFFEEGLIHPSYSLVAGLHRINEAMEYATGMKSCGKVVIDVRNKDAAATEFER